MNFFKTKPRTPPDIVRGLREAVNRLEASGVGEARRKVGQHFNPIPRINDHFTQANEDVSKNLQQVKGILSGDSGVLDFRVLSFPQP